MNILIIGGDLRTLEIIKKLKNDNNLDILGFDRLNLDTITINNLSLINYDAIIFPVNGMNDNYDVSCSLNTRNINLSKVDFTIKEDCKVFSGIKTEKLNNIFSDNYIKLMSFDDVSIENSIPTCEGIISDIIQNTDYTINGSNITILGYGRVGKTLTNYLIKLGANVNVGVRSEIKYVSLILSNIKVFYTQSMKCNLENSNVIVNTIPKKILDKSNLNYVNKDAYIIDISSAPYGVDFESADLMGIKYTILKGIPGKVAPKTAGDILANKINMILKEDNVNG